MRFSAVSVLALATLAMANSELDPKMSILPYTSSMVMTSAPAPYPTGGSPTGIPGTGTGSSTMPHNTTSTAETSTRTGSGPSSSMTSTSTSTGLAATAGPAIAGVIGGAAVVAAFL
ncbi:hypothetical protein TRV_01904 [Trichophyton verrucosum HKI 0517]|uniref:GPI anchored protein n=1 Tax=Trichophyton verrucosum (strain HKI 0517) TaxID=663202 RepID=D4D489_TRIVH|nr:uncharacterized protein TRV_01904 [Trichophyton verrucosum HKI 0517]EFE43344.1 hypothetical protein TRV_01904 [Trichophyton verrucosum HKI 0517]